MKKNVAQRLAPAFKVFLLMHVCFLTFYRINYVFLNTFLQKATGSNLNVMKFNIVLAAVQPVAMVVAATLARRKNPLFSQRMGLCIYALVYAVFIFFTETAVQYILVIAAVLAVAAGFYFTSYIVQVLAYTDDEDRDHAYGLITACTNAINLVIPLASGFLVSAFEGFTGYRILFVFGMLAAAGSFAFSTKLYPMDKVSNGEKKPHFIMLVKVLVTNPLGLKSMLSSVVTGVWEGLGGFYLNMLLYSMISDERTVGINTFLGAIAGMGASLFYGRVAKPGKRGVIMFYALGLLIAGTLVLFLGMSPVILICYNILFCGAGVFISTSPLTTYMAVLQKLPQINGYGSEVHTIREFWYGSGRVLGIVIAILLPQSTNGSICVLLAMAVMQVFGALLTISMEKGLKKLDDAERKERA